MTPLSTEVREHNGIPQLHVNGRPFPAFAFSHGALSPTVPAGSEKNLYEGFEAWARAGCPVIRTLAPSVIRPDGTLDPARIDEHFGRLKQIEPEFRAIVRPMRRPPQWWLDAHGDQLMVHQDPWTGSRDVPKQNTHVSFSSKLYRRQRKEWFARIVTHLEENYGDHILGYFPDSGACAEWAYSWDEVVSDFSSVQREGFGQWLLDKYGDIQSLNGAWGTDLADFQQIEVPADRAMPTVHGPVLHDPARDRRLIDYVQFHHEVVADALIEDLAGIKETLAALGRQKVCGTWFAYHFWPGGQGGFFHNSGHHAVGRVFQSGLLDFVSIVHSHQERHPGGFYLQHLPAASLKLHGILALEEDDTGTHCLEDPLPWQQACKDFRQSEGVLRRNMAATLSYGGVTYWHDFSAERWFFDDPKLVDLIMDLRRLGQEELDKPFQPRSQVAVFASHASVKYMRYGTALTDALITRQISELMHLGAPVDVYFIEDLPRLIEQGGMDRYRVAFFLDCLSMSPEIVAAVKQDVCGANRTLIWQYAAGLAGPEALEPEAMSELMDIPVQLRTEPTPMRVACTYTGTVLQYGTEETFGPLLVGQAEKLADEEIVGGYLKPDLPGLVVRQSRGWRSVWSGAPAMPAILLRKLCHEADVHVYTDTGDQVLALNDLLAVHAAFSGTRGIRLPAPAGVTDAMTGQAVTEHEVDQLRLTLQRGDTALLRLGS
jgi:hypothetical protein